MKKKLLTLFTALTILLSATPMVAHATENVTHLDCVVASADNEIDPETADDVSHAIEILENGRESFDDNYDYTYSIEVEKKDQINWYRVAGYAFIVVLILIIIIAVVVSRKIKEKKEYEAFLKRREEWEKNNV